MPRTGGESEKLGNQFERIFLAECVLALIERAIGELVVEPKDPDEAAGVELYRNGDGRREY